MDTLFFRLPQCDSPTAQGEIVPLGCRAVVPRQPQSRKLNNCFPPNCFVKKIQYLCRKLNVNAVDYKKPYKYLDYYHSYENRNNPVKQEISE